MNDFSYDSGDLPIFEQARNWKRYFGRFLRPFISGNVAEVGAGIGGTTPFLINPRVESWLCIEPDAAQAASIKEKIRTGALPRYCRVIHGQLSDQAERLFDTILYIDVVEHIDDDKRELAQAYRRLRQHGHLIVLVPAFQFLYSAFDKHVGHFRRYTKARLIAAGPTNAELVSAYYLDSLGFLLSLGNKLLLKSTLPTTAQLAFWDQVIIPISRFTDLALSSVIGRSAITVWRRP